jgi:hypothetical protein
MSEVLAITIYAFTLFWFAILKTAKLNQLGHSAKRGRTDREERGKRHGRLKKLNLAWNKLFQKPIQAAACSDTDI